MLMLPPTVRIYVALDPVDMRKSHHGLAAVVRQLGLDPLSGHLVFFTNKRGNLAKILFFDRSGLAILYKRLEKGTFQLPEVGDGRTQAEIDPASLAMILEGIDLRGIVRRKRYRRPTTPPDDPSVPPIPFA
jgi:transposase